MNIIFREGYLIFDTSLFSERTVPNLGKRLCTECFLRTESKLNDLGSSP